MSTLLYEVRALEASDGVRTTFTVSLSIADLTKVRAWSGNPSVKATGPVVPAPTAGEFQVPNSTTIEFGTPPPTFGPPHFSYLTDDVVFPVPDPPFSGTPIPGGLALFYLLMERPVEAADAVNTTFTFTKKIADTERVQVWDGNPATLLELVTGAPAAMQAQVTGDFTIEFGTPPVFLPFANYLTDEKQNQVGLVFEESLVATGDPLVWTYAKIPDDIDQFMLVVGRPGTVYERVDSGVTFNQYINNPAARTVTFAPFSEPRAGDPPPRATYFSAASNSVAPC